VSRERGHYGLRVVAIKLYSTTYCPYAWRSRIVLHEKGVEFETFEVDLRDKQEEFLEVSPRGLVPVMVHDDTTIAESMTINEYLEEFYPEPPLMGNGPAERAAVRSAIVDLNFNRSRPLARLASMLFYGREQRDESVIEQQSARWNRYLDDLEQHFSDNDWLATDNFSMADLSLYPTELVTRIGFQLGGDRERPALDSWRERVQARESVQATAPEGFGAAA